PHPASCPVKMERPPLSPTRDPEQSHSGSTSFTQSRPLIGSPHPVPQLHMAPTFRPLLPSGWTEHQAPNGMFYYYNAATGQSSWERPVMVPPPPPLGPPPMGIGIPPLHPFQQTS
ncbi:17677_t:CDS:1, partial [Acaulospora morrowiae]